MDNFRYVGSLSREDILQFALQDLMGPTELAEYPYLLQRRSKGGGGGAMANNGGRRRRT